MPGLGGGKKAKQAKKGKAKRGSGNPAKRAGAGSNQPAEPQPGQLPAAFGGGAGSGEFELPDELKDLLGPK
jgi:signal recognition particle subunit SRP54